MAGSRGSLLAGGGAAAQGGLVEVLEAGARWLAGLVEVLPLGMVLRGLLLALLLAWACLRGFEVATKAEATCGSERGEAGESGVMVARHDSRLSLADPGIIVCGGPFLHCSGSGQAEAAQEATASLYMSSDLPCVAEGIRYGARHVHSSDRHGSHLQGSFAGELH